MRKFYFSAVTCASGIFLGDPAFAQSTDPFTETRSRGFEYGQVRVIPSLTLGAFRESNPLLSASGGPSDTGLTAGLSMSIESIRPGGPSALFSLGSTRHKDLDSEHEARSMVQLNAGLPLGGWLLPMNLSYSKNKLDRGSLLSEESATSQVVATRQDATTMAASINAVRTFGENNLVFGFRLLDTNVSSATLVDGTVVKGTASNHAYFLSSKLARPLTVTSQWYVRAGLDRYDYDAGDLPVIGSRDSRTLSVAMGIQRQHGKLSGMAEVGRQSKKSDSFLVPAGAASIASLNVQYGASPALTFGLGLNRSLVETNTPGVSDFLATSKSLNVSYRFAPQWIVQAGLSHTELDPRPIEAAIKDASLSASLMWKPDAKVLVSLGVAKTRRSVSQNLAAMVNPYANTKSTLSLTYYI